MNLLNILPMEFTQSLQDSMLIAALFITALFIICTVSLALRNYEAKCQIKKLKKWRKFSKIEKRQNHEEYDQLAAELAEERAFNDTQGSMHVRLMLKYAHVQEESEKVKYENEQLRAKLTRPTKRNEKGRFTKAEPTDRDWTQASKEELLAEAKRRYPVGMKVICLTDRAQYEIIDFDHDGSTSCEVWCNGKNENATWGVNLYENGKWAQIVKQ